MTDKEYEPHVPEQAVEPAPIEGPHPRGEEFVEADEHYRAGPLTADELARRQAGGDQITSTETVSFNADDDE